MGGHLSITGEKPSAGDRGCQQDAPREDYVSTMGSATQAGGGREPVCQKNCISGKSRVCGEMLMLRKSRSLEGRERANWSESR